LSGLLFGLFIAEGKGCQVEVVFESSEEFFTVEGLDVLYKPMCCQYKQTLLPRINEGS